LILYHEIEILLPPITPPPAPPQEGGEFDPTPGPSPKREGRNKMDFYQKTKLKQNLHFSLYFKVNYS